MWKMIGRFDSFEEADHERKKLAKKKNYDVQVRKKANGKYHVRMRLKPHILRNRRKNT